jgi:hypothetical protein
VHIIFLVFASVYALCLSNSTTTLCFVLHHNRFRTRHPHCCQFHSNALSLFCSTRSVFTVRYVPIDYCGTARENLNETYGHMRPLTECPKLKFSPAHADNFFFQLNWNYCTLRLVRVPKLFHQAVWLTWCSPYRVELAQIVPTCHILEIFAPSPPCHRSTNFNRTKKYSSWWKIRLSKKNKKQKTKNKKNSAQGWNKCPP